MASISIRNLDDGVRDRLRVRAARHGRSMEAEIRRILSRAADEPQPAEGLFATLIERFAEVGGVELELPERSTSTRAAAFDP
ncbi:MAG: FitA-like ribbon-helix-helix domain-containing protein [Solirubrobacteraceae bacterium]